MSWKVLRMTNPDDAKRRKDAENALHFMQDEEKQITAREEEAQILLTPVRERRAKNHYLDEAFKLFERRTQHGV